MTTLQLTPTAQTVERNLRAWIAAGSGLNASAVIPGETDGPAPNGLYASVVLITPRITGLPYTLYSRNDDGERIDGDIIAVVRDRYGVQWHRKGSTDRGRQFAVWASSPLGRQDAAERCIVFHRITDIRPLDDVDRGGRWEERVGVELDVGYTQRITQVYEPFEVVGINIHDDDGITQTVEVTE